MNKIYTAVFRLLLVFLMLAPAAPPPARADPPPVVLRFRYWGDFKEIAIIQKTIDAFEAAHPGVTVHGERVTASGDEYVQKLLLEQAAGLTPDVIFCGDNYAAFAGQGMLMDLKPWVRRDPSVKLAGYYPKLIRAFSSGNKSTDKLYALPRDIAPIGLVYYNKTLLTRPSCRTRTGPGAGTTSRTPSAATRTF